MGEREWQMCRGIGGAEERDWDRVRGRGKYSEIEKERESEKRQGESY